MQTVVTVSCAVYRL